MKLLGVKFKNFKSYPDLETVIDLNFIGTKLLVASNGSGKSTIFDAIIWGLYGKSSTNVDNVVNRKTKKNAKVEVVFKINNDVYSVIRYRAHEEYGNKLLLFKNNKNISQRTMGDTQEKIMQVIQISYNAMISSVIFSSELFTSFLVSKPSERLKTFESILSLNDVNEWNKRLKKKREPLKEELEKLKSESSKVESNVEILNENISEYNLNITNLLKELKNEKIKLQNQANEIALKVNELREIDVDKELLLANDFELQKELNDKIKLKIENLKNLKRDITESTKKYNELKQELEEIKNIDVDAELNKIKRSEEVNKHNEKINNQILYVKKDKKSTEDIESQISNLNKTKTQLEERLKKINNDDIEKKEQELLNIKNNIDTCPVCGNNIKIDKHKELVLSLTEELDKLKLEQKNSIKQIKDDLKSAIDNLEESDKNHKNILESNKKIDADINELNKDLKTFDFEIKYSEDYLNKLNKKYHEINNQVEILSNNIVNDEKYNKEKDEEILELTKEMKELEDPKYHKMFLENIILKISEMELEAEEIRSEIIVIDTKAKSSYDKKYVEDTKKKITNLKKKLKSILKKLEKKKEDDLYYEMLLQVFSNKESGFKKFLINKMLSIFNQKVNFYLTLFFDEDIKISFNKDLLETIYVNNEEVEFNCFSAGEKTRFEISIAFAMFMMVKTFFSNSVNLLVFDEILDKNLDQKGFNSVIDIIDNVGKSNAVFVVSHQDFYKEKFNHHISIKKNNEGFSCIEKEV